MVALQIRDVPQEVKERLAATARKRGQSLQAYLFEVINDEARRQDNLLVIERFSSPRYGTRLGVQDVLSALRTEREARDSVLGASEEERS